MVSEIDLNARNETNTANSKDAKNNSANQAEELPSLFETLICKTILLHDEYSKDKRLNPFKTAQIEDECDIKNDISINQETNLFDKFIDIYSKLIINIKEAKQNQYFKFMNIFVKTNSNINKLYEFSSCLLYSFNSQTDYSEHNQIIIKRTIELLHVLITNQNEDDESSIICCDHLAQSFNFTSSICSLLLNHSLNQTNGKVSDKAYLSLLNDKSYRLAFSVLNKLTLDNRLSLIDSYVEQFIELSVRKILDGNSQHHFIQFLSNSI